MAELPAVPVIWQNCLLYVEECASDSAELLVPVIWQNCLCQVSVIWQKAELSVCGQQCATDLAELHVCGGVSQ